MKSLIILGNGFDIAHGLETSYNSIMQSFLDEIMIINPETRYNELVNKKSPYSEEHKMYLHHRANEDQDYKKFLGCGFDRLNKPIIKLVPNFQSIFFKEALKDYALDKNWTDLEEIAYNCLFSNIGKKMTPLMDQKVPILHEELEFLKKIMINKLTDVDNSLNEKTLENSNILEILSDKISPSSQFMVLSFNYTTSLVQMFFNRLRNICTINIPNNFLINIHGTLKSPQEIILGYGDDQSEQYYHLLNKDKRQHLKFFKNFRYKLNDNYKRLMNFLGPKNAHGSEYTITVYIVGHSCGITDKTLLNEIFKHNNVRFIDVLYHKNEQEYNQKTISIANILNDSSIFNHKVNPMEKNFLIQ